MNSKKQLSALLLFALTFAGTQLNGYETYSYSNYSLGGAIGNTIDSALDIPREALDDATDIVEEPTDVVLGDEEYSNYSQNYNYDAINSEDEILDYNYNNYGYTDEDNIESDYDMELE